MCRVERDEVLPVGVACDKVSLAEVLVRSLASPVLSRHATSVGMFV